MKIVILGNSGSGKTTLAKRLSNQLECAHLDLDDIAWREADPPVRETIEKCRAVMNGFMNYHSSWVMEGCYSSLIEHAACHADWMIFLNIGVDACVNNCMSRPWEPEKYPDKSAQDENLRMLIEWVKDYETRDDEFSLDEHRRIFEGFEGKKSETRSNQEAQNLQVDSTP